MTRENVNFGYGSFVGEIMRDQSFFDLPVRDQARILGWANGCPVVEELTDPANPDPGRGPEAMANRYGEINFWFGFISRAVQDTNPALYDQLMAPVPRRFGEGPGKYEPESVPSSFKREMAPMGTLPGYALPRLFVKQLGGANAPRAEQQARLMRGLDVLDEAIPQAETPEELLALVAEGIARQKDLDKKTILATILPKGWYLEHQSNGMAGDAKNAIHENAFTLDAYYTNLNPSEKRYQGII